ncbi:PREDICTED: uncharacterized protein LOC108566509 isoform X3 [Nicrophorus vespilloides]|uniref:Uncharacterized protein LOC108566509 isoform X3 n=1 Tax=Nicrophorus vespilloides TaxID=110193 RepID=A0ABM1N509_NICVS|nr:PREDICTED: uncharacterized protein LOC108566509 isoform X3 [Nicrophorus vespilloides]
MTSRGRRLLLGLAALAVVVSLFHLTAGVDVYSNSFISPHSAQEDAVYPSEVIKPSSFLDKSESVSTKKERSRVQRSADPILSTYGKSDDLSYYKNVAEALEGNGVELSGRAPKLIQPSKTIDLKNSGEAFGAPQARQLPEPHDITPTVTATISASQSTLQDRPRQANPDIQDIITGIVKLLNGNVNVQANTAPAMPRPLRPISTRINNRGPPRISDLPPLPADFNVAGSMKPPPLNTKMPTPYPFDLPPPNTSPIRNQRPGFYRPVTIPPWNRNNPNRRPFPPRKPTPIPTYKPLPDDISITSFKPNEDILTLDADMLTTYEEPHNETTTTTTEEITTINNNDKEFEKNKEKVPSSKKKISTTTEIAPSPTPVAIDITPTVLNTTEVIQDNSSIMIESTPSLESSITEIVSTIKEDSSSTLSVTPTEELPVIPSTTNLVSTEIRETNSSSPTTQLSSSSSTESNTSQGFPYYPYRPRPGIVLDDTEYKPGGVLKRPQIVTARPPQIGEIFDITVSAIQGPGGGGGSGQGKPYVIPVDIENVHLGSSDDVITTPVGDEGFVSIDGKRTYLNLFGEPDEQPSTTPPVISATPTTNVIKATGYAIPEIEKTKPDNVNGLKPTRRPTYGKRPTQIPVRIDTCIVGDDSTCDASQHEICRTESGVSACHCRPGHARRKHRDPCRKVVSVLLSLRVDRIYERRVVWANELSNKGSDSYQQLAYEAERALESAMSMTPFSDEFLSAKVNGVYRGDRSAGQGGVFVNLTLQLEENGDTARPTVRGDIQRHLLGVIQRRSNNIGNSALWVDSPPGAISNLQDVDECTSRELNDCHHSAMCINTFGGFKCECLDGFRDPWSDNRHRAGRQCEQCSPQHCNNRGECKYEHGQEVCVCTGNYYGNQCELDGEVLGVAIGASVAAVIIIGLTLVCLVMWSRRWNREQKAAAMGSPVFGYMATASNTVKAPVVGGPPYQLTLEDRLRWAQIADAMAQTNHYAPEPVATMTRPSSALFGYPTLSMAGTLPHGGMHGTLPPIPLPRLNIPATLAGRAASVHGMRPLDNSSSSEEEDKADLLGRNFQVPRPKSRSNASYQSGIYYDVDYDQNEIYKHPSGTIPMSTYTPSGRHPFYRN